MRIGLIDRDCTIHVPNYMHHTYASLKFLLGLRLISSFPNSIALVNLTMTILNPFNFGPIVNKCNVAKTTTVFNPSGAMTGCLHSKHILCLL